MQERPAPSPVSVATMLASVESQAGLIRTVLDHVTPQVREIVRQLDPASITEVVTAGCGDSLYAAIGARLAFEKHSGFRMEPLEALEFSRYTVNHLSKGAIVIGISAGGDKSRTIEAIKEANRVGLRTIAIVGVADSPLATESNFVIAQNERETRPSPTPESSGVFALGNYLASMVTLVVIAFELGLASGRLSADEYQALRDQVLASASIIEATVPATLDAVRAYAASVRDATAFYILGGGPSHATALFGAAKLFEMPQALGVPVELEEWAHEQYFLTRPGTALIVVAPPGASVDRAREQLWGANKMGARTVVICDSEDHVTKASADIALGIRGVLPEEFAALTYSIPLEQLAALLCEARGQAAFEFISGLQFNVNMDQIGRSTLRVGP